MLVTGRRPSARIRWVGPDKTCLPRENAELLGGDTKTAQGEGPVDFDPVLELLAEAAILGLGAHLEHAGGDQAEFRTPGAIIQRIAEGDSAIQSSGGIGLEGEQLRRRQIVDIRRFGIGDGGSFAFPVFRLVARLIPRVRRFDDHAPVHRLAQAVDGEQGDAN
jgi:hypothetical protein